jgi:hypothetical protein
MNGRGRQPGRVVGLVQAIAMGYGEGAEDR